MLGILSEPCFKLTEVIDNYAFMSKYTSINILGVFNTEKEALDALEFMKTPIKEFKV